jgi:hypothetical protein
MANKSEGKASKTKFLSALLVVSHMILAVELYLSYGPQSAKTSLGIVKLFK